MSVDLHPTEGVVFGCLARHGGHGRPSEMVVAYEDDIAEVLMPGDHEHHPRKRTQAIMVFDRGARGLEEKGLAEFDQDPVTTVKTLRLTEVGRALAADLL